MEIKLTNGLMTAAVNSFGAELKSLRDSEGREYLWDGSNPDYWNRSAPFLFPIVGALRGGKVLVGGKECQMPQHGFCRNMEWTLAVQSPFSATFTLADTPETFSMYPFHFQLALKYTLVGRTIRMEFEVSNTGTEEMLFCFGTHPAIRVPFDGSDSDFSDYSVRFNRPETAKSPLYDKNVGAIDLANRRDFMRDSQALDLDYSVFEEVDTIIFDQANSDAVTLLDNRTGKEVEIRYQNLSMIAFWTPKAGAPFLCVEPWQGCAVTADADDRFESKLGVQRLAPYTAKTFTLEIEAK